jgi:micrococcal nuclease
MQKDVSETDVYNRLLRYVYLIDGRMVNKVLVKEGYAKVSTFPPDVRFADEFVELEREARRDNRGLWGL